MDIREQLKEAAQAGDDARIQELFEQLKDSGQLSAFLKGGMLFSDVEHYVPAIVHLMPFFDANHEVAGGSLLANVAYHTGMVGNEDAQRMAISFLLMHGANPNDTFTPTENMEDAQPLSIFNMLITSQIGKPIKEGMTPLAVLEDMTPRKLTLEATEDEPSKLEQIVSALHPFNLLQTKFQGGLTEDEAEEYILDPWNDRPPFDARQLMMTEEIIEELVRWGADLGAKIEHAPDNHHNNGFLLVAALNSYVTIIDNAIENNERFGELLAQEFEQGWDKPEFDLSMDNLKAARGFYDRLFERARDIYMDSKNPTTHDRGPSRQEEDGMFM